MYGPWAIPNDPRMAEQFPEDFEEADFHTEGPVTCVICEGPLELLGALGRRQHFRCRDCGLVQSIKEEQ